MLWLAVWLLLPAVGITRWKAYDVGPLTVSAVVAGALGVAGVAIGAWRARRWIGVTSLLVCALAAILQLAAFVANTAN